MKISYTTKNSYLDELQKKNKEKRLEIRKELFEKTIAKNKEENKSNYTNKEEGVFLDISEDAKQKAYKAANNPAAQLQKLYKKLREYESEVASLMKKLNFTDNDHEANQINEKIVELNQKISAIKEQIQNISKS